MQCQDKITGQTVISYVRSDQSALKWNVRVLRTGSGQNGPAHGSQPLSSLAQVSQSAGIWKVAAGKNVQALLSTLHLNGSEPVLFGRPNGHMESDPRLYKSWNHPNEPVVTLATTNLSKSSKDVNTQKGLKFTICPFIFHFKK